MEVRIIVNSAITIVAHINSEFHCSAVRIIDTTSRVPLVDTLIVDSISLHGVFSEAANALIDAGQLEVGNAIAEVSAQ